MMTNEQDRPQRDARGLWAPGNSGNPLGKPKRVAEITDLALKEAPAAFTKIVELMGHKDPKVAMAAAVHILDRAFGKPAQSIQSDVRHMDVGQTIRELYLQAVSGRPGGHGPAIDLPAMKMIEGEGDAVQKVHIVNGWTMPTVEAKISTPLEQAIRADDDEAEPERRYGGGQ
jgi:hypothetical protein